MSKFKFPNRLGDNRPNPFQDETGENPFGDARAAVPERPLPAASSPYSANERQPSVQPYLPEDYETFLPHRGTLVFRLGVSGCWLQGASLVIATVAVLLVGDFATGLAYAAPAQLFGLALSVPACILGQGDLKAIRAGAMNQDGERNTQRGLWFGIIGSLLGGAQLLTLISLIIYNEYYA